jgi:hypothetical protein
MREEKEISYSLKDIAGRKVTEEKRMNTISTVEKLNTSSLVDGVYLLEIQIGNNAKISRKVVIQH